MLAFVGSINQSKVCAVDLSFGLTRGVHLLSSGDHSGGESVSLHVVGTENGDHVAWSVPNLKIADELAIRITEDQAVDPPNERISAEDMVAWARALRPAIQEKDRAPRES
jgi:hypothetical protein